MDVPQGYITVVRSLNDHALPEPFDVEVWIRSSLERVDARAQEEARKFISALLARNPSVGELEEIWEAGDSAYYVMGDGIRSIYLALLKSLESN